MKGNRKTIISTLLTVIAVCLFFTAVLVLPIPLGTPDIEVKLGQTSPWHIRPGESVQVKLGIANEAWLLAAAKDVEITVTSPEGFTVSGSSTNEYKICIGTLRGTESQSHAFNITASISALPGTYHLTIMIFGWNLPQKTLTPEVVVELPSIH